MATEINEIIKPISRWQHAMRAFKHRNFRLFFYGQTISMLGTWSQIIAMSWLVWRLTNSSVWLGIAEFSCQFPLLIFSLFGGAIADRYDQKKMMMTTQGMLAILAVVVSILTLTGYVKIWQLIFLEAMAGVVLALEIPLRNSFVTTLVGKKDMLNAMSLSHSIFHSTRMIGPVVAGYIVSVAGEGLCFGFNAVSFLPLIIMLSMMKKNEIICCQNRVDEKMMSSIKEGLRFFLSTPQLKIGFILTTVTAAVQFSYVTLMPIFADKVYGGGAVYLGYLMGAGATGSILANIYLAQRRQQEGLLMLSLKGMTLFGTSLLLFGFNSCFYFALMLISVIGFSITMTITSIHALFQHLCPDHLRGRMASFATSGLVGLAPFGILLSGFIAKYIGAPKTVILLASISIVVSMILYFKINLTTNPVLRRE